MKKACVLSHYAITPLGAGSAANYVAIREGFTALRYYAGLFDLPESVVAAKLDYQALRTFVGEAANGLTDFETLCVASAAPALTLAGIDPSAQNVRFVISTTKANVALLGSNEFTNAVIAANNVVKALGGTTLPIVVSNACISGIAAQITAKRLIEQNHAKYVVVIGADQLSRFIVSGFQSFKALSDAPCRPFDVNRTGLNLGEASATIIFEAKETPDADEFVLTAGAIHNDANHLSGPSRTAEGLFKCIEDLNLSQHAPQFINAHGTATAYNDQMESIAIHRAGLENVPTYSLKGYFGHTLGAAGVLETIMSLMAAQEGCVLPTPGFEELGVSHPITVSNTAKDVESVSSFLKIMSGFGGVNAAVLFERGNHDTKQTVPLLYVQKTTSLNNGIDLDVLYREMDIKYPKFHKMDGISKLCFLAAEELLGAPTPEPSNSTAVVLITKEGCNGVDANYLQTIMPNDFFPSPALFVYTLPNIPTAEIAIRHHLTAETSAYLLNESQSDDVINLVRNTFLDKNVRQTLLIKADYFDKNNYECRAWLIGVEKTNKIFNTQSLK